MGIIGKVQGQWERYDRQHMETRIQAIALSGSDVMHQYMTPYAGIHVNSFL